MRAISVAIVNHNTCEHLRACLASIPTEKAQEVVVIDNSSTDDSVEMVQAEFPWVRVHANPANPGYGTGANQAIGLCHADYVLLLNSDTRLQEGALQALSAHLDQNPQAAVVGPRLVNPDGSLQPSCYSFPTPLHVFLEESRLSRLVGSLPFLDGRYLRTWNHAENRVVPWVLGAALAIRRQAFDAVGGFESSYFMYAEEVDLCYRLHEAGWQTHYTPVATIVHVGGASTSQRRAEMMVQYFTSLTLFYRRHYSKVRQRELTLILKSIVLARLLRDLVELYMPAKRRQRARVAENLTAWRSILSHPMNTDWIRGNGQRRS